MIIISYKVVVCGSCKKVRHSFSTFAWFTASSAANVGYTADTETIATKASSLTLGDFTITAVSADPNKASIALTDTSGDTWVYVGNQKTAASSGDKVATINVKYSISYSGSQTGDELAALWTASVDEHLASGMKVRATSDSRVRFLGSATPANAAAWAGTAGDTGIDLFTVSASTLKGLTIPASNQGGTDCFVAISGLDEVETSTNHTITFTPQAA